MKKFEIPEMNISMFDAESVTMLSAVGKALDALEALDGVDELTAIDKTTWAKMTVTV